MAKNCIICESSAGSHEHVFPAALGGRRTNKKIYCVSHNNGFGRHVAQLETQLSMFNAVLKVRPDRRDTPKPFIFSDQVGDNLSMLGQQIETAPPPSLNDLGFENGTRANLKFGSMGQFETWKADQRKNGWDVRLAANSGEVQKRYFVGPISVQLGFGGYEALQAVGYLALTFFAQYFPAEVRGDGLEPFKKFLMLDFSTEIDKTEWNENLVWWDGRDAKDVFGENPFPFGHTVITGVSGSAKRAYAYISFFSSLNFGVDLGPVDDARERMVQVFIDPKAEKAPDDLVVINSETFSIEVDPSTSDLSEMILSGSAEAAVSQFLHNVSEWHFSCFVEEIDSELSNWRTNKLTDTARFSESLVQNYSQRVLNLLDAAGSGLKEHLKRARVPPALLKPLENLVEVDDTQPYGISRKTNDLLELAKNEIAMVIKNELDSREPNPERIALLLGGGPGVAVVAENVVLPLLSDRWY